MYLLGIFFFLILVFQMLHKRGKAIMVSKDYYSSLESVIFEGEVKSKKIIEGNTGIIRLDLISSNIDFYDVRDSQEIYAFVLKDKKCELLTSDMNKIEFNDKIVFKESMVFLYRNNELVYQWKIIIPNHTNFFRKARKYHKL